MDNSSNAGKIKKRILKAAVGSAFTSVDFADVTENSRVGVILARLEKEGIIRRVVRGIYYKPEYNKFLKEYIAPSPTLVAEAIARSYGWTIVPCGDTALNILGLSTQVLTVYQYASNGQYKEYRYENIVIKFKKTTNKEISNLSFKTALIVQALKALGKDSIDEIVINKIEMSLSKNDKRRMLREAQNTTSWIYEYIKKICQSDSVD